MLFIQLLVDIALSFALSNPLYLLNEYIKNSQITQNPDTYLSPHGYPAQTYIIPTADGYLLELERIPFGKVVKTREKRPPVLLCHGTPASSFVWLFQGPGKSLGFRLADQGYDVWMINFRGNTYSRGHVKYTPKEKQFWNFSAHELGIYDLPASVDHILQTTDFKQIVLIGHSSGSSAFQIMVSTLPQYNDKLKALIHLGPVAALPNSKSAFKLVLPILPYIYNFYEQHTPGEFAEHDPLNNILVQVLRSIPIPPYNLFEIVLFLSFGYDSTQFNPEITPVFASHFLNGASFKILAHLLQFLRPVPDSFAQFDYGRTENIIRYGTPKPPPYNVSRISVPFRVYSGTNDVLANPIDSKTLYEKVPNKAGFKLINGYNHLSYIFDENLNLFVNDDIIKYMNKIKNK